MKLSQLFKRTEVDMTEGRISSLLFYFALPLLLGNIFQQLYNTVDTLVVGQYVGKVQFAAVGTISPIINTLIGFFQGFSAGAGIIISRYFGAKDKDGVEKTVHTSVALTLILCLVFTVVGIVTVPLMLRIVDSPADVAAEQTIYLTIYFAGVAGLLIYNLGSSILRSVGNSFIPFLFLVGCALMNIGLDLLFVLVFKMGTAGVAYATVISQTLSAVLVVIVLLRTKSSVQIHIKQIRLDTKILKEIVSVALPLAIQLSITAFSNVFVQSYINYFGTDVMGGWTAYNKLDQLLFLPMQALALATTTFVSQNLGGNQIGRARKGVLTAFSMAFVSTAVLVALVQIFAPTAVRLLIDGNETEVIKYGCQFLRMNSPFFLVACVNQVFAGSLKGSGRAKVSMIFMLSSFVVFRQIYLFVMTKFIVNTPASVAISYPVGWLVCSILMLTYFLLKFPKEEKN